MKNSMCFFLLTALLAGIAHSSDDQIKKSEVIKKTLRFTGDEPRKELIVDNINGSIRVTAYAGDTVEMAVKRTTIALSARKSDEAKKAIYLDVKEDGNTIILYVEAPYRQRDGCIDHRGWRYYGYDASFDFELQVPQKVDLYLKTINDGEIKVTGISGKFDLHNINGGIDALDIAGSGKIYALNGDVNIRLAQNPQDDCYFGSLNGEINVGFLPGLSADLRIKNFNGEVYSDFAVKYLKPRPPVKTRVRGKFIYKADSAFGARVGNGGPEIEFDAFNGDIKIVKK